MTAYKVWKQKHVSGGLIVNIGSGNGSEPGGTEPLSEPMLTQIHDAIWHH